MVMLVIPSLVNRYIHIITLVRDKIMTSYINPLLNNHITSQLWGHNDQGRATSLGEDVRLIYLFRNSMVMRKMKVKW